MIKNSILGNYLKQFIKLTIYNSTSERINSEREILEYSKIIQKNDKRIFTNLIFTENHCTGNIFLLSDKKKTTFARAVQT